MMCDNPAFTANKPLPGAAPDAGEIDLRSALMEVALLAGRHEYGLASLFMDAIVRWVEASALYAPMLRDDADCRAFVNPFEEALYRRLHKPERAVTAAPVELFDMYVAFGHLLFERGRFDEAAKALEAAIRINPVNCGPLFELAEICKMRGDWEGLLALTLRAHDVACTLPEMGRFYRNLGFYHIERKNYDLAVALFHHSLAFDPESAMARNELLHIHEETGQSVRAPDADAITAILEANGISPRGGEHVIGTALPLAQEAVKAGRIEAAVFYRSILYAVTLDESTKAWLESVAS